MPQETPKPKNTKSDLEKSSGQPKKAVEAANKPHNIKKYSLGPNTNR